MAWNAGRIIRALARPLARRALVNLTIKVAGIPLALATNVLLARFLGVGEFGQYSVALSIFLICAMPVSSALTSLVVREVGLASEVGAKPEARGAIAFCGAVLAVAGFVYVCLGVALDRYAAGEVRSAIGATLWMYPLFVLVAVSGATLRALHFNFYGVLPEHVLRQGAFLLTLAVAILMHPAPVDWVRWAFAQQTLGLALAAAISFAWVVVLAGGIIGRGEIVLKWRVWTSSLVPFLVLGLTQVLNTHIPMLALGYHALHEDAGYYRVAEQLAGLASLALLAINLSLGPNVARFRALGDKQGLQLAVASATKLTCLLALPALALLVILPTQILTLLYGQAYSGARDLLVILAIGTAFSALMGPVGLMLNMLGHERSTMRGMLVACGLNIGLAFALVPCLGGVGAALSSMLVKIFWNIALYRVLLAKEGYSTLPGLIRPRLGPE